MTEEDDDEIWRIMTEDVEPLSDRPNPPRKKPKKALPSSSEIAAPRVPERPQRAIAKDLDRRTEQKLIRGQMPIEARLDLHGMTQEQAHNALTPFILQSYEQQKRCVIVVTGKGKGILQTQVPLWLEQPPLTNLVLKTVHAQPKDGGSGALYVYLRRQR